MDNYQLYLLVFARVIGAFIYNPLLSRKNIPTRVKIGASIGISIIIAMPMVGHVSVELDSVFLLAVAFVKEGIVGFILGFIVQMFLSMLLVAGEYMDIQSGLGMAKIYDASSGIQMSSYGSLLTYMFIFYFFITNSHLSFVKLFALSYKAVPVGFKALNPDIFKDVVLLFGTVLTMAIKFALPLIVAEIVLDFSVGILMKAVPQIQVMQVNIQVKLLFGLFIVFLISTPLCNMIEKYMNKMIDTLVSALPSIAK